MRIGEIGQYIVCLIIDEQEDETHYQRAHDPNELFTCAIREIEDAGLVEGIAGSIDIEPAE